METRLVDEIRESFSKNTTPLEVKMMNPLILAYMGDAVYEIHIRKFLLLKYKGKVNEINKRCVKFVKATSQSHVIHSIMDELSEEEIKIVKKGRNASPKTVPRNTDLIDYKMATGFESLLGYLYLIGDAARLEYIIEKGIIITLADKFL